MAIVPPKVLLIRFSSIGDIVLTTPVIRALHQQLGAEVHLLTKKSFGGVLAANPYVQRTWTIEKKVGEVLPALRREGFTAIIDLHRNLRSLQVKLGLFGTKAYSFDKLNREKWLLTRWKVNRMPDVHIVDRYLAAAAPLGVTNDGQGLDHFIPPSDEVDPAQWLPNGAAGPYVAFVTGAAHATKRLPREQIIAICRELPMPILLLGGPDEQASGDEIARAAGAHVVNTAGRLRLQQSASLVRQAACVLTHDTGLMHMAAAFRRPIVSVWGNTVPAFGMYPYYPAGMDRNVTMEVQGLPCRPCSKIGYHQCPKGHFRCMMEQDVPAIIQACANT
ncbi:MAG: glycosyltransferase family 9 protein [Lewinella sp.]|nr:glycosyltransferase family 9 protein [Lewinella sp.]